jgi:hypothetical protein
MDSPADWGSFPLDNAPRYMIEIAFMEQHSHRELVGWNPGSADGTAITIAERVCGAFIGSLRRAWLDRMIIRNESSLKRIVKTYFQLRTLMHSFVIGERRAGLTSCSASRVG